MSVVDNSKNGKRNKKNNNATLNVRMTKEEYDLIKRQANLEGLSLSEYVKFTLLNNSNYGGEKYASEILIYLTDISNEINCLEDNEVKSELKRKTMRVYRRLNGEIEGVL